MGSTDVWLRAWICSGSAWQLQASPNPTPSPSPRLGAQAPGVALSGISFLNMVRIVPTSLDMGTAAAEAPSP